MTKRHPYFMGIDGGGSGIRVVIVTPDLSIRGQSEGPAANPSTTSPGAAARIIQAAMQDALAAADLAPAQITAVGIGVAGAAARHSEGWLRSVVSEVTPGARCIPSSDYEIALTGARGERYGVLVLAGTGSLAYGVNAEGASALVGGWGYLLDDKGSGYWIGLQGLQAVIQAADGRGPETTLTHILLGALDLRAPLDLIPWLYRSGGIRTRDIAQLAPLVLAQAAEGDEAARSITTRAAAELALAARTVMHRLNMAAPPFAFAGGLLNTDNPLSKALCRSLGLETVPAVHYPPVTGAALLAMLSPGP